MFHGMVSRGTEAQFYLHVNRTMSWDSQRSQRFQTSSFEFNRILGFPMPLVYWYYNMH